MNTSSPRSTPRPSARMLEADATVLKLCGQADGLSSDAKRSSVDLSEYCSDRVVRLPLDRVAAPLPMAGSLGTRVPENQLRRARLQRECEIAVGPVLLLAAASALLVLVLGVGAMFDTAPAAQTTVQGQPAAI
jgi:hypothetical protein